MIRGAIDGKNLLRGQYTPTEFGKITIWQLCNLFGYGRGSTTGLVDLRAAFWKRHRILGTDEFTIWCKWHDEMSPALKGNGG